MSKNVHRGVLVSPLFLLLAAALFCASCSTTPGPPDETADEIESLLANGTVEDLYTRANAEFDAGRYVTAFNLYQAVIDRDSSHLGALVNVGLCARLLGDVDGAIEWYDRALAIAPDDPTALQNRITAALLLGRITESIPFAQRLTRSRSNDAAAWRQLGQLHMETRQFEDAIPVLDKAAALDESDAQAQFQLGLALAATDQYAAATRHFARALVLAPNLRDIYAPYVQVLMLLGNYQAAWDVVAQGQTRGAVFDPDLILELQRRSGQVGPR